jgi:hypothetical protein
MRRRGFIAVPLVLLAARPARAVELAVRTTGLARRNGRLLISVGVSDIIQPSDVQHLTSGFATRVLIRVALFHEGTREAVTTTYRLADIVYDLWEERFRVQRSDARGVLDQRDAAGTSEAISLAADLIQFPVSDLGRLIPGASYRLVFSTDLNPLSEDVVAELRRWLARPPGQGRLAPGDSFFGSLISIFPNPHIEDSARRIQFASQSFVEPYR